MCSWSAVRLPGQDVARELPGNDGSGNRFVWPLSAAERRVAHHLPSSGSVEHSDPASCRTRGEVIVSSRPIVECSSKPRRALRRPKSTPGLVRAASTPPTAPPSPRLCHPRETAVRTPSPNRISQSLRVPALSSVRRGSGSGAPALARKHAAGPLPCHLSPPQPKFRTR
jgi:hypothetical protein